MFDKKGGGSEKGMLLWKKGVERGKEILMRNRPAEGIHTEHPSTRCNPFFLSCLVGLRNTNFIKVMLFRITDLFDCSI